VQRDRTRWPCQHSTFPGGPSLVDTLLRHGVDTTTLECPDVHRLARTLARGRYVAQADMALHSAVADPLPPLPPVRYTRRSLIVAIVLGLSTLAAFIFACGFFGRILIP
jgi:hypothetical protein